MHALYKACHNFTPYHYSHYQPHPKPRLPFTLQSSFRDSTVLHLLLKLRNVLHRMLLPSHAEIKTLNSGEGSGVARSAPRLPELETWRDQGGQELNRPMLAKGGLAPEGLTKRDSEGCEEASSPKTSILSLS